MKKTIAVLFGGQSSEHIVSCMSAANVIDHLDPERFEPLLIGITQQRRWLLVGSVDEIRQDTWRDSTR